MSVDNIETATSDLDGDLSDCSTYNNSLTNNLGKQRNDATPSTRTPTSKPESDIDNCSTDEDNGIDLIMKKLTPYLETKHDETKLSERLHTLGVKTLSDMKFITNVEKDFEGIIKPIQCRRLEAALLEEPTGPSNSNDRDVSIYPYIDANKLFSKRFIEKLTGSERLSNSDRLKFVRRVGDEIYDNIRPATRKICTKISAGLIKKYQGALDFFKHDEVGLNNLATQIHAHVCYVKKLDNKRKSVLVDGPDGEKTSRKKFSVRENFGISEDMDLPNELPEGETVETQKKKQTEMQQMAKAGEINMRSVIQLMKKTYGSQRASIAQNLNIEDILKLWPFIGYSAVLKDHFFTLMPKVQEMEVAQNLQDIVPKMLRFLRADTAKKRKGNSNTATKKIIEILKSHDMEQPTMYLQRITMILCLGEKMQQDMTKLFIFFEETTSFDEVQASSKMPDDGKPIVAVLGSDLMKNPRCYVVVEKRCISPEQISAFKALMVAFMAYFVFKITYPQEASGLLEFLQRVIYNIKNDETTKGSRVERTRSAKGSWRTNPPDISPKFQTLMREFDHYCKLWAI